MRGEEGANRKKRGKLEEILRLMKSLLYTVVITDNFICNRNLVRLYWRQ